ncbi:DUF6624 domain-containing protein [Saccharopolyspora sp. NPDC049357]|uniref:DUF6624 domain-containing protein n=1 Tax=Saccharopolyspora sp. NPDC049357 TaxID=3154507 RepID=UPI00342C5484
MWLRAELLRRARKDQWAREAVSTGGAWSVVQRINADNTCWLAAIIGSRGWPGHRLVGADGAHAAWLLAQHSSSEYRAAWLDLLRSAVERGDARARDLAFLEDRVRVEQGLAQRHGTQWGGPTGSTVRLFPLADAHVNPRRAALGLPLISECDLANAWSHTDLATQT